MQDTANQKLQSIESGVVDLTQMSHLNFTLNDQTIEPDVVYESNRRR